MDADVQSWNETAIGSMEAHRLTASKEISGAEKMMVAMFWGSEGVILTHWVPKSTTVTGETYAEVLRTKFLPAMREKRPRKRLQLCSFITTMLLLIGQLMFASFSTTTTLKLFLMLGIHLTSHQVIFGCFQHWRTLFVVAHFQVVLLLQKQFSSGHNEPLKKHLLRPCIRGISAVKNVYIYRVITLRNDCIFTLLGWVIFFLNKLGVLRTWTHHVMLPWQPPWLLTQYKKFPTS